jgi:ABC-2 type transport system permease protein
MNGLMPDLLKKDLSMALPAQDPPAGSPSLSKPVPAWVITFTTVRKNLQITRRYLPNLAGSLVEISIRAVFFLLFSRSISVHGSETNGIEMTGYNLYIFLLGSLVLFIFTRSTLWGPINAVTNDLYNGTLEYLYSSPGSRYAYYVGVVISEIVISMVVFVPLFILLAIISGVDPVSLALMVLACLEVLVSLTAMGIMVALLALLWRQVGSIASVLAILFEMLAGAYLPLSAFPAGVRVFSYLLPFTWGYDLLRYYSFHAPGSDQVWQTILPVWQEWVVIALFAVVFTTVSRHLLGRAEQLAKKQGLSML